MAFTVKGIAVNPGQQAWMTSYKMYERFIPADRLHLGARTLKLPVSHNNIRRWALQNPDHVQSRACRIPCTPSPPKV